MPTYFSAVRRVLIPLVLVCAAPVACAGQELPAGPPLALSIGDSLPAEIRAVLEPLAASYPGIGFAIGRAGEIRWAGGIGWSDVDSRRPVTGRTRFRVYSTIKPLTATAAMSLSADGRLDLDAPIANVLPGLPPAVGTVTARQLAGHLAGIRDYRDGEWMRVSRTRCDDVDDALAIFAGDSLAHPPGERYAYTTFGYVLLSAVVGAAAERPFADVLEANVLEPGSAAGVAPEPLAPDSTIATPYEPARLGRVEVARAVDNSCRFGAGGFVGSATDLARFGLAFLEGRIVEADAREQMLTSMVIAAGDSTGYGFGWGVGRSAGGRRVAAHSGGAIGGRAAIYLLPDDGVVVALAANLEGESLVDEAARIADLVAGIP